MIKKARKEVHPQPIVNNSQTHTQNTSATLSIQDNRPEAAAVQQLKMQLNPHHSTAQRFSKQQVIQRATSIHYDTTGFDLENGHSELVGKKMTAKLDPNDKIKGSAPGEGVHAEIMGGLRANGYRRMIRGHLLNGHMGGLGIAANLYPITSQANSKHKNHMESYVKDAVSRQNKEVIYTVEVKNSDFKLSAPKADFECEANATDNSWSHQETIESRPSTDASRGDNIEGRASTGTDSMSFASKDLKAGWGQTGKGFSETSAAHANTIGKNNFTVNGENADLDDHLYAQGRYYDTGRIDRRGYAHELLDAYVSGSYNKWPIHIMGIAVANETDMEDAIEKDTEDSDAERVEAIIRQLEALQ